MSCAGVESVQNEIAAGRRETVGRGQAEPAHGSGDEGTLVGERRMRTAGSVSAGLTRLPVAVVVW